MKTNCGLLFLGLLTLSSDAAPGQASGGGQQASVESMPPGLRQAVSVAMERDECRIYPAGEHDGVATYQAINRANNLRFMFDGAGVRVAPRAEGGSAWAVRMTLAGIEARYNEWRPYWALVPEAGADPVTPQQVDDGKVHPQLPRWQAWGRKAKAKLDARYENGPRRSGPPSLPCLAVG